MLPAPLGGPAFHSGVSKKSGSVYRGYNIGTMYRVHWDLIEFRLPRIQAPFTGVPMNRIKLY